MEIRHAVLDDLPEIMPIYASARALMRRTGNLAQWAGGFPPRELLEEDIAAGKLYVCMDQGSIACVFYFAQEADPTYQHIYHGEWLRDGPYGVIHRIAAAPNTHGAATFSLNWALSQTGNVRIDTHRDNRPMRSLLTKLGFTLCGDIRLQSGAHRYAYQKCI